MTRTDSSGVSRRVEVEARLHGLLRSDVAIIPEVGGHLAFAGGNEHFFLNLAMAAAKAACDAAHGEPGASLVTAMARNGTEFGIRVSGLGDRWFTAPAPVPTGLYFAGFGAANTIRDGKHVSRRIV